MALTIGVPRETLAGEKRVATVPEVVEKLIKLGFSVAVESGAGDAANRRFQVCGLRPAAVRACAFSFERFGSAGIARHDEAGILAAEAE